MTKKLELYKCDVCGNLVQVMLSGEGDLVCCGKPMEHILPQNDNGDEMLHEKHIPTIDVNGEVTTIRVDNHPMAQNHYIMFLQTISNDNDEVCTKYLYPVGEAVMRLNGENKNISARSYCNIHGMYISEQKHDCSCGVCSFE